MEHILNKFIDDLVKVLKEENEVRYTELDIPYIIAPLQQSLLEEKYKDFIIDLSKYDYQINYNEDTSDGYTNGNVDIYLICQKSTCCEESDIFKNFNYNIEFTKDERYWGFCECTKGDIDYREDKGCCGHGCDWIAPEFKISKIIDIGINTWYGDEHDFWEYEENFYKSNKELVEEKEKRDRENKIKSLQDNIISMQKQLNELLNT